MSSPPHYAPPAGLNHKPKPFTTYLQVFVGPGTAFEGRTGLRVVEDFPDGLSNTILVAEAGNPVPWTKPEDLVYESDKPLPALGGLWEPRRGVWQAALADASVRFIRSGISEGTIRDAITRNDGRKITPDW